MSETTRTPGPEEQPDEDTAGTFVGGSFGEEETGTGLGLLRSATSDDEATSDDADAGDEMGAALTDAERADAGGTDVDGTDVEGVAESAPGERNEPV